MKIGDVVRIKVLNVDGVVNFIDYHGPIDTYWVLYKDNRGSICSVSVHIENLITLKID